MRTAIELARRHNVRVILNPAPARTLPDDVLDGVDVLTPNENEAAGLLGGHVDSALEALASRGPASVVMTSRVRGCVVLADGKQQHVPGFQVEAVDTTGAGDCFNSALAVALARGLKTIDAARYANAAAALAITCFGAQTSMPTDEEVQEFLQARQAASV